MNRRTYWTKRNLCIAPLVFFVRVPILLPFWIGCWIGNYSEMVGMWLSDRLPFYFDDEARHD